MQRYQWSSLLIIALLALSPLHAQDKDADINKDLQMMEKVLDEVFRTGNPDPDKLRVRSENTSSQYIEDFGIIMRTPLFYWRSSGPIRLYGYAKKGQNIYIDRDGNWEKDEKEDVEEVEEEQNKQMTQEEIDQEKIKLMTYFLMNYGDMAKDLPSDEKIMLIYGNSKQSSRSTTLTSVAVLADGQESNRNSKGPGIISVSVSKKDIDRFRNKSLSEEAFKNTLTIENLPPNNPKRMAYKILGTILKDVVAEHRVDKKWEINSFPSQDYNVIIPSISNKTTVDYEILSGYGVVYQLNMNSPILNMISRNRGKKSRIIIDGERLEADDQDKLIDSTYEAMVPDVQEAMIEYGRTLRDLGKDEWLTVKIDIPSCSNCEAPAEVEINVPQKVLEAYDNKSISLDSAIGKMKITGKGQAKDKPNKLGTRLYFGNEWDEDE